MTGHEQALAWFTAEHPVLLAAVDHAAATGFDTHTWQLTLTQWTFRHWQGHWHGQIAAGRATVAAAQRLADPVTQAHAHRNLATAYVRLSRFDDAHTELRHALDQDRRAGDAWVPVHAATLRRRMPINIGVCANNADGR